MVDGIKVFAGDQPEHLEGDDQGGDPNRLGELESKIETAEGELGHALLEISEQRLYRGGYKTFEEYVVGRWGLAKSTAYDHMTAARVRRALGDRAPGRAQCVAIAVLPEAEGKGSPGASAGVTVAETKRLVRNRRVTEPGERSTSVEDVPYVLRAVSRAAQVLTKIDEKALAEKLDDLQRREFFETVELIRSLLAVLAEDMTRLEVAPTS